MRQSLAKRIKRRPSPLEKKGRRGFRGYPVATLAFYGPNDERASKVAVGIIAAEGAEAEPLEQWLREQRDVRNDPAIGEDILAFIRQYGARTVVISGRIIGCPHEEGTDYPEGEVCPRCPFWARRDRWTGEVIH